MEISIASVCSGWSTECDCCKSYARYVPPLCDAHNIQLFLKYFLPGSKKISSALAYCNYFARKAKTSTKLRKFTGSISMGLVTRRNSYLMSALAVYNVHGRLNEYVGAPGNKGDIAAMLQPRLDHLNRGGFRVLHDICALVKPLGDITIDEEAELYITSTTIIPRLLAAKKHMDKIIENALKGDSSKHNVIDTRTVGAWKEAMIHLWDTYLAIFLDDQAFLCATILDPRNGCGRNLTVPIVKKAQRALEDELKIRFDLLEEKLLEENATERDSVPQPSNAGISVSASRQESTIPAEFPSKVIALIFGNRSGAEPSQSFPALRNCNTAHDEMSRLLHAVNRMGVYKKWDVDPMSLYRENCQFEIG